MPITPRSETLEWRWLLGQDPNRRPTIGDIGLADQNDLPGRCADSRHAGVAPGLQPY
jgi:hypothetical protein